MPGQTYLLRSRHGVYYLRMVVPEALRRTLGIKGREVRRSLGTKDLRIARRVLPHYISAMTEYPQPWEREAEERVERFQRGLQLIVDHGKVDPDDEYARGMQSRLSWLAMTWRLMFSRSST